MSKTWKTEPPYSNWNDYSDNFIKYIDADIDKAYKLNNIETFKDFIKVNQSELEINPYMRDKNALCALKMLPIFEEYPDLWKDTLKIVLIKDIGSFYDMLEKWLTIASCKKAVEQIIHLFF